MCQLVTKDVSKYTFLRAPGWIFVWTIFLLSFPALANELAEDARVSNAINLLDKWLDARQAYERIPGLSIALVHDQHLLWSKGYGKSNPETDSPATPKTVYSICSISKLFTSVAVMHAIDRAELDLDTPVSSVLPWFARDSAAPNQRPITVFDLLTHSAGYKLDIGRPPDLEPHLYNPTQAEFRRLVRHEPLRRDPGTQYFYSNIGFGLLGEVVEALSGRPYAEYVTDEILDPLGLNSTVPEVGDVPTSMNLAVGYGPPMRSGGRIRVGAFRGGGLIAARGFASNVIDLARFSAWQFRLLNGDDEILESDALKAMIEPQFVDSTTGDKSGLGFAIYETEGGTLVGHGGDCPGFRSDLLIDPEQRVAVAAIANGMDPVWEFTTMAHKLVTPAIKEAIDNPGSARKIPDRLQVYIGTYQGFPWSGEWQVIPWQGSLAIIYLPTDEPLTTLRRLRYDGDNQFRVIDEDGRQGMAVSFEVGDRGEVVRMRTNDFPRQRLD